jgi:hypothetical protein
MSAQGRFAHESYERNKMNLREAGGGGVWTGLIWLRIGTCRHGNELPVSIKCREILEYLQK